MIVIESYAFPNEGEYFEFSSFECLDNFLTKIIGHWYSSGRTIHCRNTGAVEFIFVNTVFE